MEKKQNEMQLDERKLKEIAHQLRCPSGEEGVLMGKLLTETNSGMIRETIALLQLSNKNRILELGHGNCEHLSFLLKQALQLRYFGMEISEVMKQEAVSINKQYVKKRQALFQLYNGKEIPYVLHFFDCVLTVNTIYFWRDPVALLNEIYRVLKPGGICILTYVKSSCMEKLPFVANNNIFSLYSHENIKQLVDVTAFEIDQIKNKTERVKSKSGEWVEREYAIVVLSKALKNNGKRLEFSVSSDIYK